MDPNLNCDVDVTVVAGVGLTVSIARAPAHPVVGVAGGLAAAVGEPLVAVAAVQAVPVGRAEPRRAGLLLLLLPAHRAGPPHLGTTLDQYGALH